MTTKIHSLAEGLGNLAQCKLTAGQSHALTQAATLLEGIKSEAEIAWIRDETNSRAAIMLEKWHSKASP